MTFVFLFFSCLQNLHFSMTILPHPIFLDSDQFPGFRNFFIWQSSRSKCTWLCFHLAERFCVIFHDIHKKRGRRSSNLGYKIQKFVDGNILAHTHHWRESTQIENSSRKMEKQVLNIKLDKKHNPDFYLKDLLILSSPIALADYRLIQQRNRNFWDTL